MSWFLWLIISGIIFLLWVVKKVHFEHKDCLLTQRLDAKRVVVTGCNQGIGFETVGELARRGAHVIMACRNLDRCHAARQKLLDRFGENSELLPVSNGLDLTPIKEDQLVCEYLDLASIQSIHAFADRLIRQGHPLDILINNAGVNLVRAEFGPDGIEEHVRVNHLGHFLLTNLLRPLLDASDAGRVILISSLMHRFAEVNVHDLCRPLVGTSYSNSKLLNVIHARELAQRWDSGSVSSHSDFLAVSVHPGFVMSELFRHSPIRHWFVHRCLRWLAKTPWQGSQTIVYCALADNLVPGAYYAECRVTKVNSQALSKEVGNAVWNASEQLIERWESANQ